MKVSKKISPENVLLVGFPSNGLVGTFTISYLINNLEMKQIGEIDHLTFHQHYLLKMEKYFHQLESIKKQYFCHFVRSSI